MRLFYNQWYELLDEVGCLSYDKRQIMSELSDLISLTEAAKQADVSRNTMHRAAKSKAIKSVQLGRAWFIYASDIERWKKENYRPEMALRYPMSAEVETRRPLEEDKE